MGKVSALGPILLWASIALAAAPAAARPQPAAPSNPAWMEPVAPFRIADRLYYVGSRELAALLIDSGNGLILIDAGLPDFAPRLLANIRTLGFDPTHVRILLNSQAHFDHAGGLAAIKAATSARMLASAPDAVLLERGGKGDFAWGDDMPYPAVKVDGLLRDGQRVKLGAVTLTAHLTPGHTKGCTTWTMPVSDRGKSFIAQFNCSLSVPGYRLVGNREYPGIAADYKKSLDKLRRVPCEIFLGTHGSFFDLDSKRARLAAGAARNVFADPEGCRRYLDTAEASFLKQLAREEAAVLLK